ncbi:hypothetical protein [Deinococcus actinosclerus]|uniref:Uncharacterized protein n=1 Tax=Deinococcus actinosclerus TaxID=1768108 RepID=A0ABM5X7F4_9DEIO|nr:hypothetical protein [Deinococcus actinosclerus]ALW89740.1 hypothetical protein AUC44_13205 [Deinococcus actinosclerus]
MLDGLTRDLRAGDAHSRVRAARRAHQLAFLTLAVPGLPLGALLALLRPQRVQEPVTFLGVLLLALLLAGVAWQLARRTARDEQLAQPQRQLAGAMQAATVPAVPFLIGCAFLASPLAAALLWGTALTLFLLTRPRRSA